MAEATPADHDNDEEVTVWGVNDGLESEPIDGVLREMASTTNGGRWRLIIMSTAGILAVAGVAIAWILAHPNASSELNIDGKVVVETTKRKHDSDARVQKSKHLIDENETVRNRTVVLDKIDWQNRGSKVVIPLPEPFVQVRTGGAGRFLIFHFKQARKLSVFDVSVAKFVHDIPLSSDDVQFAAGRDKLMVVLSGQRLLQRWSLTTFEREKIIPIPDTRPVLRALMGCNSTGPLVLWSGGPVDLWDVQTMKVLKTTGKRVGGRNQWDPKLNISADGQTLVWSHSGLSPSSFTSMRIIDGKTTSVRPGAAATSSFALPNADASLIFSAGLRKGVFDGNWTAIPATQFKASGLIPTEDPRFFLAVSRTNDGKNSNVSFCVASDCRSVFTLTDLEPLAASTYPGRKGNFRNEPRVHYLPDANLFVSLPEGNQSVILRKFDLMAALDKLAEPYLFVLSTPKLTATAGTQYVYQLDVKSKSGGLTFKREAGPQGMLISEDGRLSWPVPTDHEGKVHSVVVSVRDGAGHDVYHAFEINVP